MLHLAGGLWQHNGRLPFTADNGAWLRADTHKTWRNVAAVPGGDAEQRAEMVRLGEASYSASFAGTYGTCVMKKKLSSRSEKRLLTA